MAERAFAAFGRVQFLFNSAGAAIRRAKFLEIDDTLMEKTFALNVNGTLYCMQASLPHMLAGKHGVIVNMDAPCSKTRSTATWADEKSKSRGRAGSESWSRRWPQS